MILQFTLLALAFLLIIVLMLQVQGTTPSIFGQGESRFRVRQGVDKLLFRATIALSAVFVVVAVLNVRFDW